MAGSFSNYTEANIIETTLRGAAYPVPAAIYVALFTASPTDANITANEIQVSAFPAYTRKDAAAGAAINTGWTANANGVSTNAKVITFAANNGAGAVTATHFGLYDAATGGNLLIHDALVTNKTLQVGDVVAFSVGALTVSLD